MNIDYLKLFVRISVTNNISQAGSDFGLSPAVASNYINKLEQQVGVRLLHRSTRKISLSEEGKIFLPHAEQVVASVDAAYASVNRDEISYTGTLRIAAPASFGRMHLVHAINAFMRRYPSMNIDLRLSDAMVDLVEGGFDLAIRNTKLKDSSFIARKIYSDERVVCAAPSYLKQFGEPQTPDDLTNHNCLHLSGIEQWQFKTPKGVQIIKTLGNFKTDNGEAIRDACIAGLGITVNSKWNAYQAFKTGELVEILKDYPLVNDTDIWAVYPSSRLLAPKVRVFIDFIVGYFEKNEIWETT